jgi:hypothetical protein
LLPAQQQAEPLSIAANTLPRANFRHEYRAMLTAHGGMPPYQWEVTGGELPVNLDLSDDGVISGLAKQLGEFHFVVRVTDSSKPPHKATQELTMRVVTPLLAEWVQLPMVNGQHVGGKIKVTNGTDEDFDLTFIVLAINEIGRATALGYQRFVLKKDTSDFELSFGQDLPHGVYDISVDVVAEAPEKNAIYRVHLTPANQISVEQGP